MECDGASVKEIGINAWIGEFVSYRQLVEEATALQCSMLCVLPCFTRRCCRYDMMLYRGRCLFHAKKDVVTRDVTSNVPTREAKLLYKDTLDAILDLLVSLRHAVSGVVFIILLYVTTKAKMYGCGGFVRNSTLTSFEGKFATQSKETVSVFCVGLTF